MKLDGIRVIDLSVFLPGPYLTLAMADHGAEVIKIEPPGEGDPGRHIGLSDGPSTVFFRNLNRGKKSVVLDLKDPAQREALLSLAETADVFVESYRPGTVDRLGVGYEMVRARNPRIVYCSISAFGQDSEWRGRPAHDLALEAESGLLSMTLGNDGKPAMPGIAVADVLAGLQGLSGVLMALLRRDKTGAGDYLDISMHDVTVGGMLNILGPTFAEDRQPVPAHERTTGGAAFYRPYETQDGRYLVLAGRSVDPSSPNHACAAPVRTSGPLSNSSAPNSESGRSRNGKPISRPSTSVTDASTHFLRRSRIRICSRAE
jgi:crotonobetainyl-CoA:carnitine CoA-transferase CaiB-like acyl-CoA transferase